MLEHHRLLFDVLDKYVAESFARAGTRSPRVCVIGRLGHGDHARAIALASAVRAEHPTAWTLLLMHTTAAGSMVEYDMAHHAQTIGVVNDYYNAQRLPRPLLVARLRKQFDVVFDCVPYAVGTYWNLDRQARRGDPMYAEPNADDQLRADQCLAPFRSLYDGYPFANACLRVREQFGGLNQWEILAESSGLSVGADDLQCAIPMELAPWPTPEQLGMSVAAVQDGVFEFSPAEGLKSLKAHAGSADWSKTKFAGKQPYVVVGNSAGQGGSLKEAPVAVFKAIVAALKQKKVRCVQVGGPNDPLIEGTVDRRGLRLPLSAKLVQDAIGVITIEGFLPYVAAGVGTPSMVLFGPTMMSTFMFEGNLNLVKTEPRVGGQLDVPCPYGSCFWMTGGWGEHCMADPEWTECVNFITPMRAAASAQEFVSLCQGKPAA